MTPKQEGHGLKPARRTEGGWLLCTIPRVTHKYRAILSPGQGPHHPVSPGETFGATGWMQGPGEGVFRRSLRRVSERGGEGAHHSVKSKSEEHQEKDDGPERREGQPG